MRSIGFTGTRKGMTPQQRETLRMVFQFYSDEDLFHHGDCVGADSEAHELARLVDMQIHLHPPDNPKARAFCRGAVVEVAPKPYLERNHDIVDSSSILIAAPATDEEELRSGTWATVRYARKTGKTVVTIWPSGRTRTEN